MSTEERKGPSRRAVILTGLAAGGGLAVGAGAWAVSSRLAHYSEEGMGEGVSLNAWVRVRPDGRVALSVPQAEMGQGVYTSLPMLIAEELEVNLDQVDLVHPQPAAPYANEFVMLISLRAEHSEGPGVWTARKIARLMPYIVTGGSTSIRNFYEPLRQMGAAAREMLIGAAAAEWGIPRTECRARNGTVVHDPSGRSLGYGALAEAAASVDPPSKIRLKGPSEFRLVGKPVARIDVPDKVFGHGEFGIDVRRPDMLFAAMRHCPVFGGKITRIGKDAIEGRRGIVKVVELPDGVAVVADNTWRAKEAALALEIEVDAMGNGAVSSETIGTGLAQGIAAAKARKARDDGKVDAALEAAASRAEADYEVPYLSHACMEPMNCTALVEGDRAEVWVGHQAAAVAQWAIAEAADVPTGNVVIHQTLLGGGFGRRGEVDNVRQAARIARAVEGRPVQLTWSREEDIAHDVYRPAARSRFEIGLDAAGKPVAWRNRTALQSVLLEISQRVLPFSANQAMDVNSTEGTDHLPYATGLTRIEHALTASPVPVGFWRSVGHSQNAFFTEGMIDELAHRAGADPVAYRLELLAEAPRFAAVLSKAAAMAGWGRPLPAGTGLGVALHESFGSIVAEVAQVKVEDDTVRVEKVWCAIDCGVTVNPDTIVAQMESGIIFGLTAALYGEITVEDGGVVQQNFPDYEMVRMAQAPEISVEIMPSTEKPGGVGEPGTPPIAPAVVNALFAATDKRLRSLPLTKHGLYAA